MGGPHLLCILEIHILLGGDMAQEVRAVVWQSECCQFDPTLGVSLSKTPNPQLLLRSWLVPCMAANRRWCVNVCV